VIHALQPRDAPAESVRDATNVRYAVIVTAVRIATVTERYATAEIVLLPAVEHRAHAVIQQAVPE